MPQWVDDCNSFGRNGTPFLLLCDFALQEVRVIPLNQLSANAISIHFPNHQSVVHGKAAIPAAQLQPRPISFVEFQKAFKHVQQELAYGNTFLCNLTASTPLHGQVPLKHLYESASSQYKVLYDDKWLCYSPERFVLMQGDTISTNPMKGTIDASIPNAKETILNDAKETAEHYTIVDLLRNDLSIVSNNVQVKKFRYIQEVKSVQKTLLQVSSEIQGTLPENWQQNIGTIMQQLLPAGSITGAPKRKTIEIINEAERMLQHQRGYYTGIAAVYDGATLDSCVLIRFIEQLPDGSFVYKSGGGVTHLSTAEQEYKELCEKIYIPSA